MFATIVVPLDGTPDTEVAIHPALALASQTGVDLLLTSFAQPDFVAYRADYLRGWARSAFIPCEVQVGTEGSAQSHIIAAATSHAPALVCMASHGHGFLGQGVFGTVAADVIRDIGAPILVAGPHCRNDVRSYTDVIVAVDESDESAAILPAATDLALALGAKLQIVQVIDPADLARALEADIPADDLRESAHVAKLARQLPAEVSASWDVLHNDDPAAGIVDYARIYPTAIVALATHARSGLSLLVDGSIATHVVRAAENPVLLLH
jgi:nucleotide-binding universal stress UspA family protein